jgi:hypothetical protein
MSDGAGVGWCLAASAPSSLSPFKLKKNMPPQLIAFALQLLEMLITHSPEITAEIKALLTKADPTDADWDALHAKVAAKSYRDYVPATALPQPVPISVLAVPLPPPAPPVSPQADKPAPAPAATVATTHAGESGITVAPPLPYEPKAPEEAKPANPT